MLDLVEKRTFILSLLGSFLVFLFFPPNTGIKIFFGVSILYFVFLFFLCVGWAEESNPEIKYLIGFLVALFHTFWLFLGSAIGMLFIILIFGAGNNFDFLQFLKNFFDLKWIF